MFWKTICVAIAVDLFIAFFENKIALLITIQIEIRSLIYLHKFKKKKQPWNEQQLIKALPHVRLVWYIQNKHNGLVPFVSQWIKQKPVEEITIN